jgi:hypothetical protein
MGSSGNQPYNATIQGFESLPEDTIINSSFFEKKKIIGTGAYGTVWHVINKQFKKRICNETFIKS